MDFSGCPDDASFGPAVRGCRGDFDFTIKFEKIFFSIIPPPVFVAFALARIIYIARKPARVGGALLPTAKLVAIFISSVLQLALLVLSSTRSHRFGAFFIPADALTLLSVACMLPLSYLEHSRSPRPSILLSAYLFVSILLDIAQARTLWLASTNRDELVYTRIFTSGVALKALIIILESYSKARWVRWDVKEHSPEETTGLYGLGAYVWLNKLFLAGYTKVLRIDDLFPLDKAMASERLYIKLAQHIEVPKFRGKKHGLARATARALAVPLLLPVGPRIALGAFQFCQPFLINTLLEYLEQPANQSSKNIGYGLIGATVIVYIGIAASGALYWYFQERAMYMARGLLATAIYRKTTKSRSTASDDSAALTLMSADTERIIMGCLNLHEFWANTIEAALACWLLSRQIGPASVAPLIIVSGCAICTSILARYIAPRQKRWMEKIQKRVGLTSTVIGQMKHLKISGLAETVQNAIQSMRMDELEAGSNFRRVLVFAATVGFTPLFMSPVIAFAFASRTLEVATIFTSMSFIMLLAAPLGILFQMIPNLLAAFACLNRIQTFLEQEPRIDFRSFPDVAGEKPLAREKSCQAASEQSTAKVTITSGSFGWEAGKNGLRDINLEVPHSRLTIVVGPVASGKSTLCKTLLGEVPFFQGQVTTASSQRKVGYCDQNPHLFNTTIRQNIIGFASFNQERYNEVIEATMLQPDLDLLPQGDNTNIGSNGITLSGGQKQRVSMARALYLDTDFYIFDDILSGLDADTEEQVFLRVFSPAGLLRRRGATALLCTHSVRHLPLADHIVALGTDGTIVEQGSFQELMANKKYVSALGVEQIDRPRLVESPSAVERSSPKQDAAKTVSAKRPAAPEEAERTRMTGDWAVYRHYYARISVFHRISLLIFSIGWGGLQTAGTVWLTVWSDGVAATNPPHSNSFYNGIYAVFQVGTLASLFAVAYFCLTSMITVSGGKMHQEALKTVINAPLRFFTTTDTGVIVNLFSQDMTLVDGQLPQALLNLLLAIFKTLGLAAVMATSSPYVAITYPFLAAILYVLQKFYLRTSRQIRLLDLEAKSPLYSHFIDTIKGIATFRAFGWVQDGVHQTYQLLDTSQRPAYLLAMIQRWLALILQLIVAVLAICVVTLATQLRSNTALTGASLVSLMSFGEQLVYIIRFYTDLETSIGAVSRLKAFSENVKPESREGETIVPPAEWPLQGAIEVNGVSASYGDSEDEDATSDLALNNLHLTVAPGEKVAICGRSGSGKSSLLLLLLRLLDPLPSTTTAPTPDEKEEKMIAKAKSASMTIDGLPLDTVSRTHLRGRVIALPQEPVFLPSGTPVRTNLDPHDSATEAECRAALEAVSLWSFVVSRGGLDAPLVPDTLSQGQKQLFSLARAIVRRRVRARERAAEFGSDYCGDVGDGGVLLLDEVSSSVDQETDEEMQRVIKAEFAAYTIVMVSHRLGMVMGFDRVVVMDAGRIVESGRPTELVEREGSRFRELWMVGNAGKE